jgi:acyl carrier protein
MMSMSTLVRGLLAYQIGRAPSSIAARDGLDALGVTPLGLVQVALEVEELAGIRVAPEKLEGLRTVDELIAFFASAVERKRRWEKRLRAA